MDMHDVLIVSGIIVVIIVTIFEARNNSDFDKDCQVKGGHTIIIDSDSYNTTRLCIDPKAIIKAK